MTTENIIDGILITGTADNDSILNFGDDVTIDSGSGNDTVYSGLDDQKADRVSINAGAGDNVISVQGGSDSVTIRAGDGNNVIGSTSPNNAVFSGAGNDSIVFYTGADNNTIDSGEGNDVIDAVGHNVTINTGGGNDKIRTYRNAYDITIKAGTGDDDITLGGPVEADHTNVVQYAEGDGNDTVSALSATDTLQIILGSISGAELVGNNVVITVGGGKITLAEANNMNVNILDADGILNQTVFSGGSSVDTVVNDTLISGTDDDDYLMNDKGKNVTISGLDGNDTIENTGDNTIIDSGEGDNLVSVAGAEFVTVTTGDGSNTVYSDSNGASGYFHFGDGKNSIVTSNRYSTIIGGSGGNGVTLHNGAFGSYAETGDGDDTVAVGHYDITVEGGEGNDLINLYRDAENSFISMGKGNDTVAVYNNQHAQTFQYSGGNDLITGFDANDTLKIVGPASSTSIVSDGNLIFDFGDGTITLAGVSSAESLNVEYFNKWSAIDGGFVYSGHATNDTATSADVSLVGADLKDSNGDGAPDNVKVKVFKQNVLGIAAVMSGLSGEITLNNSPVGVIGDNNYEDHFIAKVRDDAPDSIVTFSKMRELCGISDGATVNATENDIIAFDENAKVHLDDVANVSLHNANYTLDGSAHSQIGIANNGAGADLTVEDNILTKISGLEDGYSITLVAGNNISDEVTFSTDGGQGTISAGKTTLIVDGDEDFAIRLADTEKNISGLKNFSGSATLIGNETFDSDIALAIQRGSFTLGTDENYSSATLANSSGESLNIYYTNDTTGGVIDLSDETLTNTLIIGQGEATTVIGSQGDDQLIGNSPAVIQIGNAGKDTFRGGANLETVTISDYVEGEDVIYHARPFADLSINGSIEGSDYVFKVGTKSITVKDGAEKVVKVVDVNGESRNFSKYLTLDDNDPATVTAQSGVATIDALLRTTDINIIGSDDDNTIISSSGDCTLYGGEGNDTFVRGTRAVDQSITIADYTENEDAVRHSRPFSEFSLLSAAKSVGDDYVFEITSAKIEYTGGANKKIKVVDVNGDVSYFGDYITIRDYDADNIAATEKVKVLDASERTEDINLVGNSIDNTILSGTGNNTLTGGEGNNVFVYGAGNDIITDYEEGDTISLGSAISNTSVNGSNVIFTTELGTLTVQNAVSKNLNVYEPFDVYYLGFIEGKDQITITNSEELASLENAKTSVVKISGSQITNLSQFTNSQIVSLGSGQQIVNLNNEDGNVVIVNRNSSGNKNIIFNGGADLEVFNNSNVSVNVNLANAENSTITANAGNITLGGYDYNKDAKIVIPNVSDVADAIVKNSVAIDGNKIKTSSAAVTFDNSKNSRLINLVDGNGRAQKVGFVENTSLNLTDESENLLIKAGTNSAIISGSGNDTILAGSGAVIDAGIGQNQIYISSDEDSLNKSATVVMSNGSSTVHGFGTGYDSNNSRIKVDDLSAVGFTFVDDGLVLTSENSQLKLAGVGVENSSVGAPEKILIVDDNSTMRTAVAKNNQFVTFANDSNFMPQTFIGQNSGLDFSNYNGELNINLAEGSGTIGAEIATLKGFDKLQAGNGYSTLSAMKKIILLSPDADIQVCGAALQSAMIC